MNRKTGVACLGLFLLAASGLRAWPRAQPNVSEPSLALRGGRVVTVAKGVLEGATILVRGGRIEAVGHDVQVPGDATVIDVSGQWVFPGFIDAFSDVGTDELESIGRDDDEATAPVMPHMRVVDALNPDNRRIGLARRTGTTAALSVPGEGNVLNGQSAVLRLVGEARDGLVLRAPAGMHATLGEAPKLRYGKKEQAPSTRMGQVALLRQTMLDAQDYQAKRSRDRQKTPTDLKLEAMLPVLRREVPLVVSADRRDDILTALKVADEFSVRVIVSHGAEAYRVAERLAAGRVPVILGPLTAEGRRLETRQARPDSAAALAKAGVSIAFQSGIGGWPDAILAHARRAIVHGLPYEQAVRALTLSAAEMLGVADEIGSLEPGKRADLVVYGDDPLRGAGSIKHVIVGGTRIPVGSQ